MKKINISKNKRLKELEIELERLKKIEDKFEFLKGISKDKHVYEMEEHFSEITGKTFLSFNNDLDTGFGSPSSDTLSIIAGGVELYRFNDKGKRIK